MDVVVTEGPSPPAVPRLATIYGSTRRWGSWGENLVNIRDRDAATASRVFSPYQITMDEAQALAILRMNDFWGPWVGIYLCKLPSKWQASRDLFYIFQEPRDERRSDITYQLVQVENGIVRLYRGTVQKPCSHLTLDLTTNATFQAGSMNRTDVPASPSQPTNVTSQNVFEVDGTLRDNIAAS